MFLPSACNSAPRQRLKFEDCQESPGYLGGSQQQDVGVAWIWLAAAQPTPYASLPGKIQPYKNTLEKGPLVMETAEYSHMYLLIQQHNPL